VEGFDSVSWILQRIYFKAKEGKTMVTLSKGPIVTMAQWARIHAKAWLDGNWLNGKWLGPGRYQELLETDPVAALNQVRKDFGIREEARHFDIDDPTYGGGTDESGSEPKFDTLTEPELLNVIKTGKLPDGRQAKMLPSEWISYPPLYTQSLEHPNDGSTLQLKDWAKIVAYLFRFKLVNLPQFPDLKDQYETDPATGVDTIVHGGFVKGVRVTGLPEFGIDIPYTRGKTPLFRLGDPPKNTLVKLEDVLTNPNGYARVLVRICC
jgi:hypothetical protein